jgi:hypothetical protein
VSPPVHSRWRPERRVVDEHVALQGHEIEIEEELDRPQPAADRLVGLCGLVVPLVRLSATGWLFDPIVQPEPRNELCRWNLTGTTKVGPPWLEMLVRRRAPRDHDRHWDAAA